ncbi:MAG: hypothetical protein ABEN55_08745 [Bradymonadaceae bacterium]
MYRRNPETYYMFARERERPARRNDDGDGEEPEPADEKPDHVGCLHLIGIILLGPFVVVFWFLFGQ